MEMLISLMSFAGFTIFFLGLMLLMQREYGRMKDKYFMGQGTPRDHLLYFLNSKRGMDLCGIGLAVIGSFVGFHLGLRVVGALLGAGAGFILPRALGSYYRKKRLNELDGQLVQMLTFIGNGMKAGLSFPQAIESAQRSIGNPMGQELSILTRQLMVGVEMPRALASLEERVPLRDMKIAVQATMISLRTGANLPEAMKRIAETIRSRKSVQGKIKSLTAQGRAQGVVVGIAPFVFGGLFYAMDPTYMDVFFNTVAGNIVVGVVILMQVAAFLIIQKIVRINV